ncbi:MAG: tRNA threonylcarbamoyladenosine biosynthesis protein TsaB [Syntrophorhabdus sp. PtaB.Bin047]|jgi:tRNA threonylcarbamoyladenosine biosynthesis protein TsaB|nr:MAG: tRNA threonylcarbamoyladenosine biosynthesis protein TsaB [Syntrophorhabdus sp. PtaB.Bin047]
MANRLVLAIDNSIDHLLLALAGDRGLIEERRISEARSPSQILPEAAGAILLSHGNTVRDLTGLVVTLGPGSFTGIRVALSFCKGIHAATGVPLTGVPTLDALAFALKAREGSYLCPIVDAKKSEVFLSLYHVSRGTLTRLSAYTAMKPGDVPGVLRTPCICFGTGSRLCEEHLSELDGVTVIHDDFDHVRGDVLIDGRLPLPGPGRPADLRPVYGRRSEAEIKFNVAID